MPTTPSLKLDFEPPRSHRLPTRLSLDGAIVFDGAFSYTPHDFVAELTSALSLMSLPGATALARGCINAPKVEWRFAREGDQVRLALVWIPDDRRIKAREDELLADIVGPVEAIRRPLWRGLRRLATAPDFEQGWGHPFPAAALERLTAEVKGREP